MQIVCEHCQGANLNQTRVARQPATLTLSRDPSLSICLCLAASLRPSPSVVAASRVCGKAIQTIAGIIIMVAGTRHKVPDSRERERQRGGREGRAASYGAKSTRKRGETLQGAGKVGAVHGA